MSRKFYRGEVLPSEAPLTAKLGDQGIRYRDTEVGKFVKLGLLDSQHVLCASGDLIDGYIVGVEAATSDGYTIGSVQRCDSKFATAEGSQAAGTGVLALGDFVVAGTAVAQNTGLGSVGFAKVRKATIQPGVSVPATLAEVPSHLLAMQYLWRVASLGAAGTGAIGTTVLIERFGAPE